ncbi:MAG: acyl-CoA thioesterase [Rhodospirillales bacterium]|nr:acyl-CoA thioesterase [Rhodospirillales bacterium]
MSSMVRAETRSDFTYNLDIPTRWGDNDMLGHLNNVVYYRFFEAVVVKFMTDEFKLNWRSDTENAQAVESLCRFHRPLSFPDLITAGLRVGRIGTSSITFELALFGPGQETAAATGHVVEVLVNVESAKSTPIDQTRRALLAKFTRPQPA